MNIKALHFPFTSVEENKSEKVKTWVKGYLRKEVKFNEEKFMRGYLIGIAVFFLVYLFFMGWFIYSLFFMPDPGPKDVVIPGYVTLKMHNRVVRFWKHKVRRK